MLCWGDERMTDHRSRRDVLPASPENDRPRGIVSTMRSYGRPAHGPAIVMAICAATATAAAEARPGHGVETAWPPTSDALEACIVAEERSAATGHDCIGREARRCLGVAQREPIVHAEKCYEPEVAAWARLVNRYFHERPTGEKGRRIVEVQRAWLGYRKLACDYASFHHGGDPHGRAHALACLLDETGRRAIALRTLREPR